MARTIPHRELRNNSSAILDEVRRGETIHITNHGELVATLIPPTSGAPILTSRLAFRPARRKGAWEELVPEPSPNGLTTEEVMDDLRGDR